MTSDKAMRAATPIMIAAMLILTYQTYRDGDYIMCAVDAFFVGVNTVLAWVQYELIPTIRGLREHGKALQVGVKALEAYVREQKGKE